MKRKTKNGEKVKGEIKTDRPDFPFRVPFSTTLHAPTSNKP